MSNKVELERVTKAYGDVVVLNEIDLAIPAGQAVALVGQTGSGKSTLVKLLLRFYEPTSGRVTLDGSAVGTSRPVSDRSRRASRTR